MVDMSTTSGTWRASNGRELGRALARVRQQAGLTQEAMAARLGIERTYLAEWRLVSTTEQLQRVSLSFAKLATNWPSSDGTTMASGGLSLRAELEDALFGRTGPLGDVLADVLPGRSEGKVSQRVRAPADDVEWC